MRVQPLLARDCPKISQPVVRGWRWRLSMRVDQASWPSLMACVPLVLHAERGGSIVETGYAQKNDFGPFGDFPQGICNLLGFVVLIGPPVKVDHLLVFSGFERLIANKADQIVAYCLKCIGLSNPNDDRELG
jgi:hypothetical protein